MKKSTFFLKNNLRLVLFAGMFVAASSLVACGESSEEKTTTDSVVVEPAPAVIDTVTVAPVDSAAIDTGRGVIDPKKPENQ